MIKEDIQEEHKDNYLRCLFGTLGSRCTIFGVRAAYRYVDAPLLLSDPDTILYVVQYESPRNGSSAELMPHDTDLRGLLDSSFPSSIPRIMVL